MDRLEGRGVLKFERWAKVIMLFIYDACAVFLSEYLAIITRFDFNVERVESGYLTSVLRYTPVNLVLTLLIFIILRMYSSLWRFASVREMAACVMACGLSALLQVTGYMILELSVPRSYYILYFFYFILFIAASRFGYRAFRIIKDRFVQSNAGDAVNTMIIGAGNTAYSLMNDIARSPKIKNKVVCIIDADITKRGKHVFGAPIVGGDESIPGAVEKYNVEEIFIAVTNIPVTRKKQIIEICQGTGAAMKIVPSAAQIINDEVSVSSLREVSIEDLLGREPVRTDLDEILGYIRGKTVIVTGAGGSIGSELSRQLASHEPKQLILFDIHENTTYELQLELRKNYPQLDLVTLIGSVRNSARVESVFEKYHPGIVFHAAAHKHVPLMEDSPNEAIKNNVFGTFNVALSAAKNKVERMVLISTDKAVNPTNIMGASKRLCEMVIQGMYRKYPSTRFVAVRFGNVLGSSGSVVPIFKKQIEQGGPVTVTDKNIVRYFMTIPEAVSLVIQASVYAKGGEIFVLDMGEPVRIDDMARNLIRLSGYEPDVDIMIEYTGLRPGEKLYEECLKDEEGLQKTANNLIFIAKPIVFDDEKFFSDLAKLKEEAYEDREDMKELVAALVPSYKYKKINFERCENGKQVS